MKLTITSPSVSTPGATAFVLADDSVQVNTGSSFTTGAGGQIREGFVNKQRRQVQKTPLFRAAYTDVIPRYNLANTLSFTVQRAFDTVEDCMAFIAFHPDSVPVQGEITLIEQSTTGVITRYLPNAVIDSVECIKHIGKSCDFQYTISGNGAWQTSP